MENIDEQNMTHAFNLARQSLHEGDLPFGALVVKDKKVIAESKNTSIQRITGHAEVNALQKAVDYLGTNDLSECTLYSNFEPCAMCSFLIRDLSVGRVVFSVTSPHWGGNTRWNILSSEIVNPLFTSAKKSNLPEVVSGVLEKAGKKMFTELDWEMHTE